MGPKLTGKAKRFDNSRGRVRLPQGSPKKRQCRKCKADITRWTLVEGIWRNTQNRKFCLTCSPFGSHNTKPDDPARPSKYSQGTEAQRACWNAAAKRGYERHKKFRIELVQQAGGKCIRCGYDRCLGALDFHHRDPRTKKFTLTVADIRRESRQAILREVKKCDLLCANCHREEHYLAKAAK